VYSLLQQVTNGYPSGSERDAGLAREATLAEELAARTGELATRNTDYSERIEHQAATIDVLKAMSASPGDTQPVFDLITRRAQELCNCRAAVIFEYDGELVHYRSAFGGAEGFAAVYPMVLTRGSLPCRAIMDKQIVHVRDMDADPDLLPIVRDLVVRDVGVKSALALPLLQDGEAIGSILTNDYEPGGFTDSQVALLQTFAEQAVIAITSAETYRALREALDRQTATAEVLQAINTSPGNLTPVFQVILDKAHSLCGAALGALVIADGQFFRAPRASAVATVSASP